MKPLHPSAATITVLISAASLLAFILEESRQPDDRAPMPHLLFSGPVPGAPDDELPVWVESDVAVNQDGDFAQDLFSQDQVQRLLRYLVESNGQSCIQYHSPTVRYINSQDPAGLVYRADLVLEAVVDDTTTGFERAQPGTLLKLQPTRALKGVPSSDHYFVHLPIGEVQAGPFRFCVHPPRGFVGHVPAVGSRVLLLVERHGGGPYLELFQNQPRRFVVLEDPENGAFIPPGFAGSTVQSALTEVEAAASAFGEPIIVASDRDRGAGS